MKKGTKNCNGSNTNFYKSEDFTFDQIFASNKRFVKIFLEAYNKNRLDTQKLNEELGIEQIFRK